MSAALWSVFGRPFAASPRISRNTALTCSPPSADAFSAAFLACSASRRATSAAWPAEARPSFISCIVEMANWTSACSASTFSSSSLACSAVLRALLGDRVGELGLHLDGGGLLAHRLDQLAQLGHAGAGLLGDLAHGGQLREHPGGLSSPSARPATTCLASRSTRALDGLEALALGAEVGAHERERGVDAGQALVGVAAGGLGGRDGLLLDRAELAPEPGDVAGDGLQALAARVELAAQDLGVLADLAGLLARGARRPRWRWRPAGGRRAPPRRSARAARGRPAARRPAGRRGAQLVLLGAAAAGGLVGGAGDPRDLLEPVAGGLDLGEHGAGAAIDLGDALGRLERRPGGPPRPRRRSRRPARGRRRSPRGPRRGAPAAPPRRRAAPRRRSPGGRAARCPRRRPPAR